MKLSKPILLILIAFIIIGAAIYIHATRPQSNPAAYSRLSNNINPVFQNIEVGFPQAHWTEPAKSSEGAKYGELSGQEILGQVTSDKPSMDHFDDPQILKKYGYYPDTNLDAAGPGAMVWGYKKTAGDLTQVVIVSYQTAGLSQNPMAPIQFNCPCKIMLKVFISDPFKNQNPENK